MSTTINFVTYLHLAKTKGLCANDCATLLYVLNSEKHDKTDKKDARMALQYSARYHMRHFLYGKGKSFNRVFSKASNKRLYFWAQNKNSPV